MTAFVGIDLAWSGRNPSGLCLLRELGGGMEVLSVDDPVLRPRDVFDLLARLGPDVVAAVDAPLAWRERCEGERQMGRVFGRYHAAPYTAGSGFLRRRGLTAGPELADRLGASGWEMRPEGLTAGAKGRWAFEVYPHAFHVSAFRRDRILKYKKGPLAVRRAGLMEYRADLERFVRASLPGLAEGLLRALPLVPEAGACPGRVLKSVEDQMDGVTCALAAYLAWRDGVHPCELFGDIEEGYIVVPCLHRDGRFSGRAASA